MYPVLLLICSLIHSRNIARASIRCQAWLLVLGYGGGKNKQTPCPGRVMNVPLRFPHCICTEDTIQVFKNSF